MSLGLSFSNERVYKTRVHDTHELRQRLLYVWCSLEQSLIDDAVDQCPTPFACLCTCQRRTFWTYFVTINLSSLHLMNFMFHTMLDAADNDLRVHYKSNVCFILTRQRWTFFHVCVKISSSLQQCKNYKNWWDFPKLWSQMYCHLFCLFTVYNIRHTFTCSKTARPRQKPTDRS